MPDRLRGGALFSREIMTTESSRVVAPRGFRRVAPAFVLVLLSPFVAEFLLGDFAIDAIWLILIVGPMYGAGALLVREVTRRLGRGWPTMLLLALAYGLLEEGVAIQTLFNPNYLGLHLLREAYVPALGIGGWWTAFVLTIHTVWSISVPIALTEALFSDRRTTPWLGNIGLGVTTLVLAVGGVFMYLVTRHQDPFSASTVQVASVWVIIAIVVAIALRCPRATSPRTGTAPSPLLVGIATLVFGAAVMTVHKAIHGWPLVAAQTAVVVIMAVVLFAWSRRATWTPLHTLAAAAGPLIVYAVNGFPQPPVVGSKGTIDLVGNAIFAAIALALLIAALKRERQLCSR